MKVSQVLIRISCMVCFLLFVHQTVRSQGIVDKINKVAKGVRDFRDGSDITDAIKRVSDMDGRKSSLIKDEDLFQQSVPPERADSYSRLGIAKNLLIDVLGQYPEGYVPKWRFFSYPSNLQFETTDLTRTDYSKIAYRQLKVRITQYKGQAILVFYPYFDCECMAELRIDSFAVIGNVEQSFRLINFQKMVNGRPTGEKCVTNSTYRNGGWEGKIGFSSFQGDIKLHLTLEQYKLATKATAAGVSFRYVAEGINIENEVTAEAANKKVEEERLAKERYANYLSDGEQKVSELLKVIETKYSGYDCRECYNRGSYYGVEPVIIRTVWNDGYVSDDYDWSIYNTFVMQNACNQELTFIGIKQLYSEEKGYYYVDVVRKMEANYLDIQTSGLFWSVLTSLTGLDGDIRLVDKYSVEGARLNSIQWVKVVGKESP